MFKRLLVPTDGSPLSEQAVAAAIELARGCGCEIIALAVAEPAASFVLTDGATIVDPGLDRSELQHNAAQRVQAVARAAAAAGVPCRVHTVLADCPWEEILRAASAFECDMIVMGSHGRRGWSRLLAGSQTQKVLERASVPVFVYRPPQPAQG